MVVKKDGSINADKQTNRKSKGMASISSIALLIVRSTASASLVVGSLLNLPNAKRIISYSAENKPSNSSLCNAPTVLILQE